MECAHLVGSTAEQSFLFPDLIWYYQWYEWLSNFLHHTSAVPHPFLLLIATNLALASCLGWKWSLWLVPTWLMVQKSRAVFFLTSCDIINDMKHFWTVCIIPQPWHSHFCCWLLLIWSSLYFWAENGAYGLFWLGWRYNGAKLYLYRTDMIVSIIWNTSETVSITPQPCHSHFSCWLLPIWP